MCLHRAENAARYMNDRGGGARFQRSQSQNDLDRQTYDDRFFDPKDLRTSASGYDIQRADFQREPDGMLRRHPSDVGDRYRRSNGEWDGGQMSPAAINSGDLSRTGALELRRQPADQKLRTPSDPSRSFESPRRDDYRDREYRRDYDGRRLHSAGDEVRRSHENVADVSALSKKPSVRTDNPKNEDIMNWLQLGDGSDPQARVADSDTDGRDINCSTSNYGRSVGDRPEDHPSSRTGYGTEPSRTGLSSPWSYPAARNNGDVTSGRMGLQTSGPRADREDTGFPQFGVSNPTYDGGYRASVSDQTQSSESSVRGRDAPSHQQSYIRDLRSFSNNSYHNSDRPRDTSSPGPVRSMGYASSGDHYDGSSQSPPAKPVHMTFPYSPSTRGWDYSTDLPPILPPKLANQQAPLKPPHVSPSQSDQYRRLPEDPPRSVLTDHQLRVIKDDANDEVASTPEYAVVYKRPTQSMASDRIVDDPIWRDDAGKVERPGAGGSGYPSDMVTRSRLSPDGTLDSTKPSSTLSNLTIQPLAVHVSSSSDFGNEQRPGSKMSSQENLASPPPVRPPLPPDDVLARSGMLENLSEPARSEPQGGAENIDLQVSTFFLIISRVTSGSVFWRYCWLYQQNQCNVMHHCCYFPVNGAL